MGNGRENTGVEKNKDTVTNNRFQLDQPI